MKKYLFLFLALLLTVGLCPEAGAVEANERKTVSSSKESAFFIKSDGSLWGWGENTRGQVGNGTNEPCLTPVKIMDDVVSVQTSQSKTMAIKSDGSLWVWGGAEAGKQTSSEALSPAKIVDSGVAAISNANSSACLIFMTDGSLWTYGHLWKPGEKYIILTGDMAPKKALDHVVSASVYGDTVAAVTADGGLWTWGRSGLYGFLGDGSVGDDVFRDKPVKIMDGVESVQAAVNIFTVKKTDGSIWSWGNCAGENSTSVTRTTPQKDFDNAEMLFQVENTLFAVQSDKSLWSWGNNTDRQMGNGSDVYRSPVPQKILDQVEDVAGYRGAMALRTDGSVWAWGNGVYWEGLSRTGQYKYYVYTPQLFMENAAAISFDQFGIPMIITRSGELWASEGVCGEGRTTSSEDSYAFKKIADDVLLPGQSPAPAAPAASAAPAGITVSPNSSAVLVNGREVAFDAYTIEGSNYFKLRDLAYVLNGTEKQFEVGWDNAAQTITLLSGRSYTANGSEMAQGAGAQSASASAARLLLDGKELSLTAYTIGGNNYFKLRDIGQALDIGIGWDNASRTITIDTSTGYTA